MIEFLKKLTELLVAITPLLCAIFVLIIKLVKSKKTGRLLGDLVKRGEVVKDFMMDAEGFLNYSGMEKKEWVKTKVNQFCLENNIMYSEDMISDFIEKFIKLSKNVNKRERDKELL